MEKVECQTPTPGKSPTRIDKEKYDKVAEAILAVTPTSGEGLFFKELPDMLTEYLGTEQMAKIGSRTWYTTTIKLDLETKGRVYRVPKSSP